jgi:DeoR family glycerol-3-phosphate regulon repressor
MPRLNPNPRQLRLLDTVRARGTVMVEELAEMLGVTLQTVRRDVQRLADEGLLTRFHGGVRVPSSTTENIGYPQRASLHAEGKARIARAVAARVPNDCSLILNVGTTTEAIAQALMRHTGLRVITNNLNVAVMMSANPSFEVIVAGGMVRARDQGVTGQPTIDLVRQFTVDFGVIGISGIEPDGTLLDFDFQEVRVAQAIVEHSRQVFLAADASKLGRNALCRLGPISLVDDWFTDRAPPEELAEVLVRAGTRVHVAAD